MSEQQERGQQEREQQEREQQVCEQWDAGTGDNAIVIAFALLAIISEKFIEWINRIVYLRKYATDHTNKNAPACDAPIRPLECVWKPFKAAQWRKLHPRCECTGLDIMLEFAFEAICEDAIKLVDDAFARGRPLASELVKYVNLVSAACDALAAEPTQRALLFQRLAELAVGGGSESEEVAKLCKAARQ